MVRMFSGSDDWENTEKDEVLKGLNLRSYSKLSRADLHAFLFVREDSIRNERVYVKFSDYISQNRMFICDDGKTYDEDGNCTFPTLKHYRIIREYPPGKSTFDCHFVKVLCEYDVKGFDIDTVYSSKALAVEHFMKCAVKTYPEWSAFTAEQLIELGWFEILPISVMFR